MQFSSFRYWVFCFQVLGASVRLSGLVALFSSVGSFDHDIRRF